MLSEAKDLLPIEPRFTQIFPRWIDRFDQRNFLAAQPPFDCLFPSDGIVHILERFIVNETMNFVIAREAV